MHVRFTYVFVLDRNFEILILESRKRSISHNHWSQQYKTAWTRQSLDQIIILLAMHDLSVLLYKA